jgi:hypothetical protein
MRREEAFQRSALRVLRGDLLGIRAWLMLFGVFFLLGIFADEERTPLWQRAASGAIGVGFFALAAGLSHARTWARYTSAALCLLPPLGYVVECVSQRQILNGLFGVLFSLGFLSFGVYLLLPSTAARFRRARPEA